MTVADWISVEDKLPIEYQRENEFTPHRLSKDVLVADVFGMISIGLYDYGRGKWSTTDRDIDTEEDEKYFGITHWMYLPPPPLKKHEKN